MRRTTTASTLAVRELVDVLRSIADDAVGDSPDAESRIALLEVLADVAPAASAATLRVAAQHDRCRRSAAARTGVPAAQQGRGVALEVALATRTPHYAAQRRLATARLVLAEMPHTFDRLVDGTLTERQVTGLVAHTAALEAEARAAVDQQLCADPERLAGLGPRQVDAEAARLVARLDPAGVARRAAKAARDRHVSSRPAPDTMCRVSALLPVTQGVAVMAALGRAADTARAAGDPRSRSQVMADTLVERVTGQVAAAAVPLAVQVLLPARTALGGGEGAPGGSTLEPAWVPGHGPVDALTARDLVREAWTDDSARAASTLRRLFTDPASGALVAMDSRSRTVPAGLAAFVHARDLGVCRTPWCDAPIRHTDHVDDVRGGGPTDEPNLQGLCEACNYAKQAPGWRHETVDGRAAPGRAGPHTVTVTTPAGRAYTSRSPDLPGARPSPPQSALAERSGPVVELYLHGPVLHLDHGFNLTLAA